MNTERYLYLCLFLSFILLLMPFVFFLTVGSESIVEMALDNPFKQYPPDYENDPPENEEEERINYYSLLFTSDKDIVFSPGMKVSPEPEPGISFGSEEVSKPSSELASAASKEQQMVNYINQARKEAGLSTLQVNSQITVAARAKSKDMAVNNYFSHDSPTYGSFTDLLQYYGINYRAAGENLAWNTNGSVSAAHNGLMNSTGHRKNILNSNFQYVGVGIYVRNDGRHYFTQLFIGR